jgi:hypothetical protein
VVFTRGRVITPTHHHHHHHHHQKSLTSKEKVKAHIQYGSDTVQFYGLFWSRMKFRESVREIKRMIRK